MLTAGDLLTPGYWLLATYEYQKLNLTPILAIRGFKISSIWLNPVAPVRRRSYCRPSTVPSLNRLKTSRSTLKLARCSLTSFPTRTSIVVTAGRRWLLMSVTSTLLVLLNASPDVDTLLRNHGWPKP